MYKIVAAVNSMIENANLIGEVTQYEVGYYFVYNNKYNWSIGKSDEYYLVFYPDHQTLQESRFNKNRLESCISYNTGVIKTQEAKESFAELYQIVQSKFYSIESVLDDIINTVA